MREQEPPSGISPEDWAATPPAVRGFVGTVVKRLVEVEARLHQTSRNSSQPPSADPRGAKPRPAKAPSERNSGGQPGHPGTGRKLKPASEVDHVSEVSPERCAQCGPVVVGEDPEPERQQVTELPRIKPLVTEDRRQRLWWGACGASTPAAGPAPMPRGRFGPRGQAPVGYLTGRIGASHREGQDLLAPGCQPEVSVGSVGALEQAVRAALALPVAAAATYVQRQPVRKADETSGREQTKRAGLWISGPPLGTSFRVLPTRGAAGAKDRGRGGHDRDGSLRRLSWE